MSVRRLSCALAAVAALVTSTVALGADTPFISPSGEWSWLNYRLFTFDRDPRTPSVRSGGSDMVGDGRINSQTTTFTAPGSDLSTHARTRIDAKFFLDGPSINELEPAGVVDFSTLASVSAVLLPPFADLEAASDAVSQSEAHFLILGIVRYRLTITVQTAAETTGNGSGELRSLVSLDFSDFGSEDVELTLNESTLGESTFVYEGFGGREGLGTGVTFTVESDAFVEVREFGEYAAFSVTTHARLELFEVPEPGGVALLACGGALSGRRRRS